MFTIPENNWGFINDKKEEELKVIYDSIKDFFPREDKVLRFLNMDFNNLKYIIVGMEPYPTAYEDKGMIIPEATGRSFEVSSLIGKTWEDKFKQSSLRNILKAIHAAYTGRYEKLETIRKEISGEQFNMLPPGEWFDSMESQGVLFLNASLTVEPYNVGSHKALWDGFMTDLIKHIEVNQKVTWLLWGKDAQERVLPHVKNKIISCHPRLAEFVTENCFANNDARRVDWRG